MADVEESDQVYKRLERGKRVERREERERDRERQRERERERERTFILTMIS